jgi:dTDP-glucose 4,6-dehydratase
VIVLDSLTYAGNLANIADVIDGDKAVFVHGDIRDFETVSQVFRRYEIDGVVHLAAESHVDRSILGPRAFIETNVTGTLNLLLAAREHWQSTEEAGRFVHVSTDEVYGALSPEASPFNERTPYAPNSPYAASKAAADQLVRAWYHTYGFPAVITNCSNNYGPYQFPEKLIPLMILNAVEGRELPIYGDGLKCGIGFTSATIARRYVRLRSGALSGRPLHRRNSQQANIRVVEMVCDLVDSRSAGRKGRRGA